MPFEVLNDTQPLSMFLQSITGAFYSPYKTVNCITVRLPVALKCHLICGYRYISSENISIIERFFKCTRKKTMRLVLFNFSQTACLILMKGGFLALSEVCC